LVAVAVLVAVGLADREVAVGVGVFVAAGGDVEVGVGVDEAGGASTVNDPSLRLRATLPPSGSVAAALLRSRVEVPGAAPARTSNVTLATLPLGITS
jgi:hypothetical protein